MRKTIARATVTENSTRTDPSGTLRDTTLVERMAGGDQSALGELRARYAGTVYALVYGILTNPPDAEHVLSETFLEAWRLAPTFQPQTGTVHAWLTGIARRRACGVSQERSAARSWRSPAPRLRSV